jgi:hypothetical protein
MNHYAQATTRMPPPCAAWQPTQAGTPLCIEACAASRAVDPARGLRAVRLRQEGQPPAVRYTTEPQQRSVVTMHHAVGCRRRYGSDTPPAYTPASFPEGLPLAFFLGSKASLPY